MFIFHLAKSTSIISSIPPETIPVIILIVSIIGFTIIIERMVFFWKIKPINPEELRRYREFLNEGKWDDARNALREKNHLPTVKVLIRGLDLKIQSFKNYAQEMETESYHQLHLMENFLTGLGTIATIGPLLGVFGTVVGMIRSFGEGVGTKGAEVGISEALITTAMGLAISIPAYVFYNYFVHRKEEEAGEMESLANQAIQVFDRIK